jgi:hypothetical protein
MPRLDGGDDALYKSLHDAPVALSRDQSLFFSALSSHGHVLPGAIRALLERCPRYRTLRDHARTIGADLHLGPGGTARIRRSLEWLAARGLLVSLRQTRRLLGARRRREGDLPAPIAVIGIPTADRPRLLHRALQSYLHNTDAHGREPVIVIVDDSRLTHSQTLNQNVVRSLDPSRRRLVYVDRRARVQLARRLARDSGVDPAHLQFALLPSGRHPITTGAARNTLLLLTAGSLSLQVDDDTVAGVAPFSAEGGLTLSLTSSTRAYAYRFDHWDALKRTVREDEDILAAHERLLGRRLGRCLEDPSFTSVRMDDLGGSFVRAALLKDDRVRTTSLGTVGDPGLGSMGGLLVALDARERAELLRNEGIYRAAVMGRRLLRAAPVHLITQSASCFGVNLGLDGTGLLPPFMPLWRSEDSVFGTLLRLADAHVGLLPQAILHEPAPRDRSNPLGRPRRTAHQVNSHIVRLLRSMGSLASGGIEMTLRTAGAYLYELGGDAETFENLVSRQVRIEAAMDLQQAEARLRERGTTRTYRQHLAAIARDAAAAATTRHTRVTELDGRSKRPLHDLRKLARSFGQLTAAWPDIFAAARSIAPDMIPVSRRGRGER